MRRIVLLFILLIFCSSCARQNVTSHKMQMDFHGFDDVIKKIRIERWGELRFTGLLVLKEQETGAVFVVLDPTGITLLGGGIQVSGRQDSTPLKGPLKDTGIGEFLATALTRIFLLEPVEKPCSKRLLTRFCLDPEDSGKRTGKYMKIGPFTHWQVEQLPAKSDDQMVVYTQPWFGMRIVLEEVGNK